MIVLNVENKQEENLKLLVRGFINRIYKYHYPNEDIKLIFKSILIKLSNLTQYTDMTDSQTAEIYSFIRNDFMKAGTIEELEEIISIQPKINKDNLEYMMIQVNQIFDEKVLGIKAEKIIEEEVKVEEKKEIILVKKRKKTCKEKIKSLFKK